MIRPITLLIFSSCATIASASSYHIVTPLAPVSSAQAPLELRLNSFAFPTLKVGQPYESPDLTDLVSAYGQKLDASEIAINSSTLPAGLSIQNNRIVGIPTEATGPVSITLAAAARDASTIKNFNLSVVAEIQESAGVRSWTDGSLASSCGEYIETLPSHVYAGAIGDGVYRIEPVPGQAVNVYCDMTRDGGGWTLIVKQAQGDGATLQGDTAHWTQGTVLNDTLSSLNKNNGNYLSAAYSSLQVTDYRLEAGNEATMKYHTRTLSTPLVAFSNSNRTVFSDGDGAGVRTLDWFIRTSTYPVGSVITTARFAFNHTQGESICGARWGWSANENPGDPTPSHDSCGGLGAYGSQYGLQWMNHNKHVWQPATLYLWVR